VRLAPASRRHPASSSGRRCEHRRTAVRYGGFAAVCYLSRLPHLWAAGVSVCGPSTLETLARSAAPDCAMTTATMIGDPGKDAGRLRERSPVTYAEQITAPLRVLQSVTDPRVPRPSSDKIVVHVHANGGRCPPPAP
jgi:dipeptidyl aminopeptidase/acylaminoacyl peptidase